MITTCNLPIIFNTNTEQPKSTIGKQRREDTDDCVVDNDDDNDEDNDEDDIILIILSLTSFDDEDDFNSSTVETNEEQQLDGIMTLAVLDWFGSCPKVNETAWIQGVSTTTVRFNSSGHTRYGSSPSV